MAFGVSKIKLIFGYELCLSNLDKEEVGDAKATLKTNAFTIGLGYNF